MKVIEVLQHDDTFRVELVEWNGQRVIQKSVQPHADERRRSLLQNEAVGADYFRGLAGAHPEWELHVPETFASDEKTILREFIDGEELLQRSETLVSAASKIATLATVLAGVDAIPPVPAGDTTYNSAPYTNIRRRFDVWSAKPLEAGILTIANYQAANELIEEYQPYLQPRAAHGDPSPFKHIYLLSSGGLGIIDFEHFSTEKPRYYDVAYAYSRLFTQAEDIHIAGRLLYDFLEEAAPVPYQKEQLLAIMTQRAIGMHFDAYNDASKGMEYVGRAQQFLDRCLTRDVTSLIEI